MTGVDRVVLQAHEGLAAELQRRALMPMTLLSSQCGAQRQQAVTGTLEGLAAMLPSLNAQALAQTREHRVKTAYLLQEQHIQRALARAGHAFPGAAVGIPSIITHSPKTFVQS